MHYSLLNIKTLIVRRPLLSLMIVLSQIAAILSVYLSVGFINNSISDKKEAYEAQLWFNVSFANSAEDGGDGSTDTKWGSISHKFYELNEFIKNDADSISMICYGYDGDKRIGLYSGISDTFSVFDKNCCAAGEADAAVGDVFTVEGVDFTVTETGKERPTIVVNIDDIPETAVITFFNIHLNDAISKERIEEISSKISELFGKTKGMHTPEPMTLKRIQINNMFILASALILLMAIVNISVYFRYLFKKREKENAILKICGANKHNIFGISLAEMFGSYILSLAASIALFSVFLPRLKDKYQGFSLFDDKKYIVIFAATYFLVSALVSIALSLGYSLTSPSESYKRAQKGGV